MRDVAVVGSGPAGVAVATACAARGLDVVCVAPDPRAPWPNNYGAWKDELTLAGYAGCIASQWPRARVRFGPDRTRSIERAYVRIDNAALRAALDEGGHVEAVSARVRGVRHGADVSVLDLEGQAELRARLVVDATGVGRLLAHPPRGQVPAQVAFGVELSGRHGLPEHEMLFMDFSPLGPDAAPTFLYAMPFGPDRVFVEETVLVARPAPRPEVLERALELRLGGLGLDRLERVGPVERCVIPMGAPLPRGPQRVVPFGAAAGMVHPATGYLLGRVLSGAAPLAAAIERGLDVGPEAAAELGWGAVWPGGRRKLWETYRFGMEVLLALPPEGVRAFFETFFEVDPEVWRHYLGGEATGLQAAQLMADVFRRLPWRVRARLLSVSFGPAGLELLSRIS